MATLTSALRPIRVYLLILVLGAIAPGALLTGVLVWRAFASTRDMSERRLLESARVDASAVDREFASVISTLQVLATSPALDRNDLEAFYQEGRRVQSTQLGWYNILLLSVDGRQLVSTRLAWGEPLLPVAEPESLQRVIQTRQPVVGAIRTLPAGDPAPRFAIRVPVSRENGLKYVLSGVINVDALSRVVPHLTNSEEWTRTILDSEGTIAVRTRGAENYVGAQASDAFRTRLRETPETLSSQTTREGIQVYAAASRGAYGWAAVVVVPHAVLDAPLDASMTGVLIGGVLLMLCGLGAVLVVSRRLSADIAAATAAAEAVAEGRPLPQAAEAHVAETLRLQRSLATASSLLDKRARERDEEVTRADAARAEAEHANQTKDQFLAVLGHELRNPLAPALTALELMKVRDPHAFTRERQVLERQVAHMARLVNDLLDVSRLARGTVQLERRRFEMSEAIDRAVDMARPLLAQQRHTLNISVPTTGLTVDADLDRIVQVLSNLLTNAAKYTPAGGHVALTARASHDHVVIACEDDGPGVSAELVPRLFEPFAQGPRALDRVEGGLGLGLALARSLTELHGGTITVESRDGQAGSRFVVTLPLAPVVATDAISTVRASHRVDRKKVLVVDDNADACEMLRSALEHVGHVVAIAGSGPEAMTMAGEFVPDVGVLDLGLPGMNGYELARQLRKTHPSTRLIALTGYGQAGDVEAAAAAGFDAHCAKPVTTSVLLAHIDARTPAATV